MVVIGPSDNGVGPMTEGVHEFLMIFNNKNDCLLSAQIFVSDVCSVYAT